MTQAQQRRIDRRRAYRREWMAERRADFYQRGLNWDGKPRKYHQAFHNRAEDATPRHWQQQEARRLLQRRRQIRECMAKRRQFFYAEGLTAEGKQRQRSIKPRLSDAWRQFRAGIPVAVSFEDIYAKRDELAYGIGGHRPPLQGVQPSTLNPLPL